MPPAPRLDQRRESEFSAELRERARAWIPTWGLADAEGDFGRAVLEIAARFSSEVAERLDGAGEKMRRGFLDWLGVRGQAARPARMPVAFKLAGTAREAVLASAPVRLQADAASTPVVFETETDVRVLPGRLDTLVGVDAERDEFYLPAPGLSDLEPLEPLPTQWQLKSFAAAGAKKLQLDPESGLALELIVEAAGQQYRIVQLDKEIVTIEPPLTGELPQGTILSKLTSFAPFDGAARNRQEHALYLGHMELLNIEAAATLEIVGATALGESVVWHYWGKRDGSDEEDWQALNLAPDDQQQPGVIVLKKGKGAIVPRKLGSGNNSRWLRAFRKTISPGEQAFGADRLTIRINSSDCDRNGIPCPPSEETVSPDAEGMANATPLVLNNVFLPLGREPRQFDAFYLGSTEVLSKKGAEVRLCFELADPTFTYLTAVRAGAFANTVLGGVGKDRALHLLQFGSTTGTLSRFRDRDPLRPPVPGDNGVASPQTLAINLNPDCRPVIDSFLNDFYFSVAAGGSIWTWHENAGDPKLSGWKEFERLPADTKAPTRIDDIVPVDIPGVRVVLSNGRLLVHDGTRWNPVPTEVAPQTAVELASLSPVLVESSGALVPSSQMVGVSTAKRLYLVKTNGTCNPLPLIFPGNDEQLIDAGIPPQVGSRPSGGIRPAAFVDSSGILTVVAVSDTRDKLVSFRSTMPPELERISLDAGDQVLRGAIDLSITGPALEFSVACATAAGGSYLASWLPYHPDFEPALLKSPVSTGLGKLGGTPLMLPGHIVVPGSRGDAFVSVFDRTQRHVLPASLEDGVVLPDTGSPFIVDDEVSVIIANGDRVLRAITETGYPLGGEILYPVDAPFGPVAQDPELLVYRRSTVQYSGTIATAEALTLDATDSETTDGMLLVIQVGADVEIYEVLMVSGNPPVAQVVPDLPLAVGPADYWTPTPSIARIAPILRPDPSTDGNWDASLLDRAPLYFPGADPPIQRAKAFAVTATNRPKVLALDAPWALAPLAGAACLVDGALEEWRLLFADTSSNPELSWEYSNGRGWGSLVIDEDATLNLKNSGVVRFTVPDDLAASDWAGKTNHWIRARLIGGDYGREKVTVKSKNLGGGVTEQTIERSSEGIRAPSVVKLTLSYSVCDEVLPTFVLAQDSGSIRDQSDANRTVGAIVEAFVPLAVMLGRLSSNLASPRAPSDCPPECQCSSASATAAFVPASEPPSLGEAHSPATGRALFIGLDAAPSESPVRILLLVQQERLHSAFAPLVIEALVADRFVPVVADDATRALSESGLLTVAFTILPTRSNLFGKTLTWLRLTPAAGGTAADWKPTLRGAYLNAVWASARETLTRELVGSSDGAPALTLRLARPPVLHDSLELRVKEPLSDEERALLRKDDEDRVLNDLQELPGDWVRWDRVPDPVDEPAAARVYALDESNGEIRFGDGRHGMIPPIGRDAIVAFSYQRTEPGPPGSDRVPANAIAARTALNLVSPVESVEAVFAADQAAGGAPAETDDRVLRFGGARLRHRGRAVTLNDLEDLALQSSPDIAQARCFVRRGYVRLVIVMRGKDPRPNAAQVRELRRHLLDAAPVALSAPNALRIEGPAIRRLQVELGLRVATLDHAGELARIAKQRLRALFDTATGGPTDEGWALGENPNDGDIAYALVDAPYLEGIASVTLRESTGERTSRPWPQTLKPTELAVLAEDPIRIAFATTEAAA